MSREIWIDESKEGVEGIPKCVSTQQRGDSIQTAYTSSVTEAGAGHDDVHSHVEIKLEPAGQERDDEEATQAVQDTDRTVEVEVPQSSYWECEVKEEVARELYPDHVITEEMVIGPEVLQPAVLTAEDTSTHSSTVRSRPWCNQQLSSHASGIQHRCDSEEIEKDATSPAGGRKMYICDICTKSFLIRASVVKHLRIHTRQNIFCCKICKKQFSHKISVTRHEHTHTGVKPFHCEICKKEFTQKSSLFLHGRTHTGEKPFHCKFCKKPFSIKQTLTQHERTHTGEKPFQCKICNKRFSNKTNLTQHERTHTGEKPFRCKICKKQFSQKGHLTRHKSTHT